MKFLFIIHALFILTGCGQGLQKLWVDPALQGYVKHYIELAPTTGYLSRVASIGFGDPGEENDGLTTKHHFQVAGVSIGTKKKVVIRRETFDTPMGLRALYHELGHALHNLEHTDNPDDIMSGVVEEFEDGAALEARQKFWEEHLEEKLSEMWGEP